MPDTTPSPQADRARRARSRRKLLLIALADPAEPLVAVLARLKVGPGDVAEPNRQKVVAVLD